MAPTRGNAEDSNIILLLSLCEYPIVSDDERNGWLTSRLLLNLILSLSLWENEAFSDEETNWLLTSKFLWRYSLFTCCNVICAVCNMFMLHYIHRYHYSDVIMGAVATQITDVSVAYSTVCSGVDQGKNQSSASLAFVKGIHRWPVNSPHKGPVTQKMFPFDDVIMMLHSGWRFGPRASSAVMMTETIRCIWVADIMTCLAITLEAYMSRMIYVKLCCVLTLKIMMISGHSFVHVAAMTYAKL